MHTAFRLHVRDDGLATLVFDVPDRKVNVFTREVLAELKSLLADLAERGPEMGTYLAFLRVRAEVAQNNCEIAETFAHEISPKSAFGSGVWSLLASCFFRANDLGRAKQAVVALEARAQSTAHRANAALMQARIVEHQEGLRAARDLYREILIRYPHYAAGRRARMKLNEIGRAHV